MPGTHESSARPAPPSRPGPPATRAEPVLDTYHGVPVEDPYRWLEDERAPEVRAWVEAQNARTRAVLDAFPGRAALRRRLETYLSIGTVGVPSVRGGRIFHTRREGRTDQPILHVRDGVRGSDRVLLDPNPLSPDGTVALDWYHPSWDGGLVAYGLSASGDEQSTLRVRDAASGKDLDDAIPGTRACSLAWEPGGSGFYYTRYPEPGTVPAGQEPYHRHVYHHRLGEDPRRDRRVFGEGRRPDAWPNVAVSPDGRWLVVVEAIGWSMTQVFLKDLARGGAFAPIVEGKEFVYHVVPCNDRLLILTNEGASTYRLLEADPEDPAGGFGEVIPASEDVLRDVIAVGDRIYADHLRDASSRLSAFDAGGKPLGSIPLPAPGTIYGLGGAWDGTDLYFGFVSFTFPPRVHRHDAFTGATELWDGIAAPVDPESFEVEQVRFESRDGTKVPMFIVRPMGFKRDGRGRVVLTGYGGFNQSLTPAFDRDSFVWLERGGAVAVANLRGGGEYGEAWHRAGMLAGKQNVFDDFIAAAEHLVREGYTRPERLAIQGGSNGGLLVGAALTQRPDLFRAVVCAVPLLDMLRYHRFQIARLWIPEYGSAEDPEQFPWLRAYSPYHRVEDGAVYPAVLLATAESDSRVDPMHARKMAARLQAAQADPDRPILLRVETRAGHGAGKPLSKLLDEQTDVWSFIFDQLGMEA
jgi:prolyl oligopeptidase